MVFYRKYRPQNISELDLKAVRERLTSILKQKEIPHAFLFTGSKGLGKTSTARILAKAINCENKNQEAGIKKNGIETKKQNQDSKFMIHDSNSIEPCNKCDACISITKGSNLDVLEIDAASNRGIDEIRELRERIKFAPSVLVKKVYIIDEVHMLTTDAFNALLKTLEEPPSHAIFILCTTELEKVPPTITSRTFHITFQKPTREEALSSLGRVVAGEKLDVDEDVLGDILEYSEDSFRDATKILQELSISAAGKKITKEILEATYNTENNDAICFSLLKYLGSKDSKEALATVQSLASNGADFRIITEKLASILHDLILFRNGVAKDEVDIKELKTEEAVKLLNLINESYRYIKTSILPQIPLELVIIEWGQGGEDQAIKKSLEEKATVQIVEKKDVAPASVKPDNKSAQSAVDKQDLEKEIVNIEAVAKPVVEEKDHGGMFSKNILPETFFQSLLDRVKRDNHSIAGILRGCKLIELGEDKVLFEARYKFHKDKLNEAKTVEILDRRASELLNRDIKVVVEMVAK